MGGLVKFSSTRALGAILALIAVSTGTGLTLAARGASASTPGLAKITPDTGTIDYSLKVTTSGPCTDPNADSLMVTIQGAGFPTDGTNVVGNSKTSIYPTTGFGGYVIPFQDTLRSFASQQDPPATMSGDYRVTVICRNSLHVGDLGDFVGNLTIATDNVDYTSPAPAGFPVEPTPTPTPTPTPSPTPTLTPTSMQLSVNPQSPHAGRSVVITASVMWGSGPGPSGTVELAENVNNTTYRSYTTALAGHTATFQISHVERGFHFLNAFFHPNAGQYSGATSRTSFVVDVETALKSYSVASDLIVKPGWFRARLTELVTGWPLEGLLIEFSYQGHLLCDAGTDRNGVASCRSWHPDEHPDALLLGTTATFRGWGIWRPAPPSKAALVG